jgi:uncharacterized protein (TIGR02453 family)
MTTVVVERFTGFPPAALEFLAALKEDNEKAWFEANRKTFEEALVAPGRALVGELGERLQRETGLALHVEPKIGGSIMRQHRDTRFSKDKSPYKTYFGLWFWEGEGRSSTRPGFYMGFSGADFTIGAGKHQLEDEQLAAYRAAVDAEASGAELAEIVAALRSSGRFEIAGQTYKNVPAQFAREHPRAALLKHTGLYAQRTEPPPKALQSAALVEYAMEQYLTLAPLLRWLAAHI